MSGDSSKIQQFIEKYGTMLSNDALKELKEISKEQDYLKKAFDFNPCTICVIDEDNNYLNANSKMLKMMKVEESDLLGKKVGSLTKDPTVINLIEQLKGSPEDAKHITIEANVSGQKKFFWISANKVGSRILTTGLDITELKQLEEEKKFNDKLALLGEMSSFIVHEINNPLSSIVMANEIIEMENQDNINNDQITKCTDQIKTMTAVVEKIIESLKSIIRKDTTQNVPNSMQNVYDKSKIILSGKLKKNKVQIKSTHLEAAFIQGSEINLIQVLVNLISNSIDAVKELPDRVIEVRWENNTLKVIDSGSGIPEHISCNLFKKHYTSKGENGNGIGLYLSRDLLRKCGYDLVYHFEDGRTSFQWIQMPESIAA